MGKQWTNSAAHKFDQDPGQPFSHVVDPSRKAYSSKKEMTQQESIMANIKEDCNSWRSPNPMEPHEPKPRNK